MATSGAIDLRQEVLDELAGGDISFGGVLADDRARRLPIVAVVEAVDGLGVVRTAEVLERAGVAPWLEVREVTERQRERLEAALSGFQAGLAVL